MKLNKYQVDHARGRLLAAAKQKASKAAGPEPKRVYLAADDKLRMIYSGKAKLLPRKDVDRYTDFIDAFEYPGSKEATTQAAHEAWTERSAEAWAREVVEVDRLMDKLILSGDAAEALTLIDEYARAGR